MCPWDLCPGGTTHLSLPAGYLGLPTLEVGVAPGEGLTAYGLLPEVLQGVLELLRPPHVVHLPEVQEEHGLLPLPPTEVRRREALCGVRVIGTLSTEVTLRVLQ